MMSQEVLKNSEIVKTSILEKYALNLKKLTDSESTSLALDTKFKRLRKCFLFIATSLFVCFFMMVVLLLSYFAKSFYKSFILFRGFRFNITIDIDFKAILEAFIRQVASLFYIKGFDTFLLYLFYPVTYILGVLSNITFFSLKNLGVTCTGSLSSSQFLFNCIMVGLLVIIIEADYHLLVSLPIQRIYSSLKQILGFPKCRSVLGWDKYSFYIFFLEVTVSDLFTKVQFMISFLTYLLSFTTVSSFFWYHQWTPACNNIQGAIGIDAAYAILNTMITYVLVFPVTYTVLYILVPGMSMINIIYNSL
jgi:hypothetical protein